MPSSHTGQVTWSLPGTVMPPTFQKPMHAAEPVGTFSCPTKIAFPTTMVQFSQTPESSKQSCHQRWRQSLALSLSTAGKPSQHKTMPGACTTISKTRRSKQHCAYFKNTTINPTTVTHGRTPLAMGGGGANEEVIGELGRSWRGGRECNGDEAIKHHRACSICPPK
jgi:hypothetical protein